MDNTFSVTDIFKQGWTLTKKHLTFLVVTTLVYLVVSMVLDSGKGGSSILLGIASSIFSIVASIGFYTVALRVIRGETPSTEDFIMSLNTFLNTLVSCILTLILVSIGFVLLIVPGIIVATRLSFAMWLVVDKKMTAWDSIKESRRLTKGYSWKIFSFFVLAGVIILVSLIPFGLGLLISIPLVTISSAILYKKIVGEGAPEAVVVPVEVVKIPAPEAPVHTPQTSVATPETTEVKPAVDTFAEEDK